MQSSRCNCICREIDQFEAAAAASLERHGLGQDLTDCVLSHINLLQRFPGYHSTLSDAFSCAAEHDCSALLKKLNIWGSAKDMLLLFSLCLQQRNDVSARRIIGFLVELHQSATLLHEACKFGRSEIVEQILNVCGAAACSRRLGLFAIGCDCFQLTLLSKATEEDKTKIINLLCSKCGDLDQQTLRSAFNTALRLRLRLVCDALLQRDVDCVCPLSVADAFVLCSDRPLTLLIAHLPALALSPPELHEVACTAAASCPSAPTIALLLQALLSMRVQHCSHGHVKDWGLLWQAVCSCNMAAVSVIYSWADVGGDSKPTANVLHSLVATGKGDKTCETLDWLLSTHLSCFSQLDMLHAAEAAAFACNLPLLKLLLPHVPATPQISNLRVVCEQKQQQPAALIWFALQGIK
jgi:hypothetical protein